MKNNNKGSLAPVVLFLILILSIFGVILAPIFYGVGSFGPTKNLTVTVERLYVDRSSESSHYMVGTDKGVFEVDNGLFLGVWNADELYSTLKEGNRYQITTEGNKMVGMFFQYYPYITSVKKLD